MADIHLCSVPDCGKRHYGRGLCSKHYQRLAKYGDPLAFNRRMPSTCTVEGCHKPHKGRGYCQTHLVRMRRNGTPQANVPIREMGKTERFIVAVARVGPTDDCIEWPYAKSADGRGYTRYRGGHALAARAVCMEAHGAPPTPLHEAAHSCGNGNLGCVNPHHLRWATRTENEADKINHGTRLRGERAPNYILTDDDCETIRSLRGQVTQRRLAAIYGVSQAHISAIQIGKFRSDRTPLP